MDTFIDKLAQKKNAQEMIRANSAAEAAKMDQMQKQMKAYDELMQEIRRVNIKTVDNVQGVLSQCMEKLTALETENVQAEDVEKQLAGIKTLLEERLTQSEEFVHRENVKVYRNVQAAFTEELAKQNEPMKTAKGRGTPLWLSIVILVGVLVDIAVTLIPLVLNMTNVKLF